MKIRVGTSGFSYAEWKGSFYPGELPAEEMLAFYARHFSTVEINNTFYRLPSRQVVGRWAASVGAQFRFALKASQRITHQRRLQGVEGPLEYLLDTTTELGPKLGPILFQLPPRLAKDTARLAAFLEQLPASHRAALELRHESWRDPEVEEILSRHGVAWCGTDDEGPVELRCTAPHGYVRLRRETWDPQDLLELAMRLRDSPVEEAFVYFKHEASAPALAARLQELVDDCPPPAEG